MPALSIDCIMSHDHMRWSGLQAASQNSFKTKPTYSLLYIQNPTSNVYTVVVHPFPKELQHF